MAQPPVLFIQGAPGSPYTRKMLAVLRYKHIPYRYINRAQAQAARLPRPKVELLPTLFFLQPDGSHSAAVDSTPLVRRLDSEWPSRAVVPPDPATAFLDALIEDYADEWLTKAMFHYRWHDAPDREKSGRILPIHQNIAAPAEDLQAMTTAFTDRQVGRLRYVGSNDLTAPVIESSYRRFLGIFENLLAQRPFLFGARPGAADFGLFGQLTQLAHFDPTPAALALRIAPRVFAWVDVTEDLSGLSDDAAWVPRETAGDILHDLLTEIGRVYAPLLLANAAAIEAGDNEVATEIGGQPWRQAPFTYHVKCLQELRRLYASLAPQDRGLVEVWLANTGVDRLFAPS
jgi:glutathione S-transferase